MRTAGHKSAPKVRGGKVQKKNRTALSPDIYVHEPEILVVHRTRPSKGFYHVVSPSDVRRFVGIIPDWDASGQGIRAVVLTPGGDDCYGRYNSVGIVKLDAWPKVDRQYVPTRKAWLMSRLGFEPDAEGDEYLFSREQARCFLLLGTFLHELGHHVDRMNTRSKADSANGEPFAIAYELRRQQELWDAYVREFGCP